MTKQVRTGVLSDQLSFSQRIKVGDKKAFEQMFDDYYEDLCVFAKRIVSFEDDAEEVVQDVFFKIWNTKENLNLPDNIKFYLFRAVKNCAIDHQKKVQRGNSDMSLEVINTLGNVYSEKDDKLINKEMEERIMEAIEKLPEKCKEVFKLSRFEQLKGKEIAKKLNVSEKAVEAHITKALKVLRTELSDYIPFALLLIIIEFTNNI